MPPLPSPNDARGRYLLRIYTAALGYAVGHSYITVYGYAYERMVAGVFGIIAIALVVLALILAHARAEMETQVNERVVTFELVLQQLRAAQEPE